MYYGDFYIGSGAWHLSKPWTNNNKGQLIKMLTSHIRMSTPQDDFASWRVRNDDGEIVAQGHFAFGRFFRDPF